MNSPPIPPPLGFPLGPLGNLVGPAPTRQDPFAAEMPEAFRTASERLAELLAMKEALRGELEPQLGRASCHDMLRDVESRNGHARIQKSKMLGQTLSFLTQIWQPGSRVSYQCLTTDRC